MHLTFFIYFLCLASKINYLALFIPQKIRGTSNIGPIYVQVTCCLFMYRPQEIIIITQFTQNNQFNNNNNNNT